MFAAAKAIGDEEGRARTLATLALRLPPELIREAFAAAKAIGYEGWRAHTLKALLAHAVANRYEILIDLIDTAAALPRDQALDAVSSSLTISAAVGGHEALTEIYRAIIDTARWYP